MIIEVSFDEKELTKTIAASINKKAIDLLDYLFLRKSLE